MAVPVITKPANQEGEKGLAVSLTVTATESPTGWEATVAHPLPTPLSINATGKITGTITAAAGTYTVGLIAKNGSGPSAEVTFTWKVVAKLTQDKPADRVDLRGVPLTPFQLGKVTPSTGIAPVEFSVVEGFPEGVSLSILGAAEGTPTESGIFACVMAAEDVKGALATTTFTWTIEEPKPFGKGTPSLHEEFPLHLTIAGEDFTFLLNESFTFSNVDPGGFEMASFTVSKDLPQIMRGDHVQLDSGLQVAWVGRVKEIQRSLGGKTLIQCEGYGALLKEKSIAEIFVDRDLTKWGPMPLAEQILRVAGNQSPQGASVVPTAAGTPSLLTEFTGTWESNSKPVCQAWYDAHGLTIGKIYYAWQKGANVNPVDEAWGWWVYAVVNENSTGGLRSSGDLRATGPGSGYLGAPKLQEINARFAYLEFEYAAPGGTANLQYTINWSKLAVYGRRFQEWVTAGNEVGRGTDPVGYYPSGIAVYAIDQCPGVQRGVYEAASQNIVPHASYLTPVPIEQIISDMAKFAGWHWGVWEPLGGLTGSQKPRVDFRAYRTTASAYAWRHECQTVDIRENIENLYDSAQISYTEPGGIERSVEVSQANPILERAGLHRQVVLSFGTGVKEAAEVWGLVQLALLNDQARATGSATINQAIHKMDGSRMAPWMLRAGLDRLRIPDLPSVNVWGAESDMPITRVECSGSEQGLVTSVELGNGVNLIETFAAQLQANLTAGGA